MTLYSAYYKNVFVYISAEELDEVSSIAQIVIYRDLPWRSNSCMLKPSAQLARIRKIYLKMQKKLLYILCHPGAPGSLLVDGNASPERTSYH